MNRMHAGRLWKPRPADFGIAPQSVHVWRGLFQSPGREYEKFAASLSGGEKEKAGRFVRQSDRERYIFAHGLLRSILSLYLACEPRQLGFNTTQYGKPHLAQQSKSDRDIRFNLSHSKDLALVAVSVGIDVGIDVEFLREVKDIRQIVDRFFSADERRFLDSIDSAKDFERGFFESWTSKEAFLKGIATGLSFPLEDFSVLYPSGSSVTSVTIDQPPCIGKTWTVIKFSPMPGYFGALAAKTAACTVDFFDFHSESRRQAFALRQL